MPSAPGASCCDQREVRQRERREALRDQADRRDALRLQAEEPRRGDAAAHGDQRRRRMRPQALHADQHGEASPRPRASVSSEVSGRCCATLSEVGEEALLGDVDAEELRHLVEHDHEADAGLEAGQHRRGDEVGDEAQAQQPRQHQHRADQRGQRGRRRDELRRVAVGHDQAELRAGQDRQRGGGADAEHARRAEQRVDHHRDEGGVEAHRDRQPGHGRVGHGLGQHDGRGREAGDHVEAKRAGAGRTCRRGCRRLVHAACSRCVARIRSGRAPPRAARSRRDCSPVHACYPVDPSCCTPTQRPSECRNDKGRRMEGPADEGNAMSGEHVVEKEVREPVLSPVDRVSELLFGLFMALTFVGAVSVAEAGREEIRAMFVAALGCNLAWGLVDAVMYLVRTVTDRGRSLTLVRSVRAAPDAEAGRRLIERSLSRVAAGLVSPAEVEAIRGRIVALASVPARPTLKRDDLLAALAIFLIVVASTFPVVLPFVLFERRRHGEDRVARHRAGDAVLRRARARALRRLRQLEGRVHDGRAGHGARGRDQRARRMKAALRVLAALAAAMAATAFAGEDERQRAPRFPCREAVVGVRGHRLSHASFAAAKTTRRRSRSPTAARCISRRGTTTSRSARARPSSAGPSPAAKTITWELTPLARRRLGHDAGVRARAGGERRRGGGSTSTSRPNTCATATSGATATLRLERTGLPAGRVAAHRRSPASAPGPTAASATSSAGRSCS